MRRFILVATIDAKEKANKAGLGSGLDFPIFDIAKLMDDKGKHTHYWASIVVTSEVAKNILKSVVDDDKVIAFDGNVSSPDSVLKEIGLTRYAKKQ